MAFDDSVIWFGKYKGTTWTDIPDSYLQWLVNEGDPGKKGTIMADEELQSRADSGKTVVGDPVTRREPAAASSGLEKRMASLEKRVAALEKGGDVSFNDDEIAF